MFLLNHCNRAFFPLSFRVDPSQAQGRGSHEVFASLKNLVEGEHVHFLDTVLRP